MHDTDDPGLSATAFHEFGPFELRSSPSRLLRDGQEVDLPSQPLRLLQLLVSRAGDVVTHGSIRDTLWPDQAIDTTGRVHAAIRQIRRALDDNGESPQFVETIPRQGYRFVADVAHRDSHTAGWPVFLPAMLGASVLVALAAWFLVGTETADRVSAPIDPADERDASFLEARQQLELGTPASVSAAVQALRRTLREAPDFAPAHASMSQAMLASGDIAAARAHAEQAISLDPTYAVGYLRRAELEAYVDWDWAAARASLQRANELTPSAPDVALALARISLLGGDSGDADRWLEQALSIQPLTAAQLADAAELRYLQRRYPVATALCERAHALSAGYRPALDCLYRNALGERDFERAAAVVVELANALGADDETIRELTARSGLERAFEFEAWYLSAPDIALRGSDPVRAAIASAAIRRYDEAMFLIRDAMSVRSPALPSAMIDPALAALFHQTAFMDMRRRIGVVTRNE